MTDKKLLKQKLDIVYTFLQKQSKWYTGLSIKRYLRKEIFSLATGDFSNNAINSGRWSAYSHYSVVWAFGNLLEKNEITKGSKVVINPLLPTILVDELVRRGVKIIGCDIEKSSLSIDNEDLQEILDQQEAIDLVIHFSFNGIYEPILDSLNRLEQLTIPSIVFIDNENVNPKLLEVFNNQKLGSMLWNFGDSFLDEQLKVVADSELETQNWFVAWHLESRTKSILEYHLSQSQDNFLAIIEAYYFLLAEKVKSFPISFNPLEYFTKNYLLKNKLKNKEEAQKLLTENYSKVFESAVPDLFFDLQLSLPENKIDYGSAQNVAEKSSQFQIQAKEIYDFLVEMLAEMAKGSLEIPDFYLDRTYLKYFFYSTNTDFWYGQFDNKGLTLEKIPPIHSIFNSQSTIPVAKFVSKYGLVVCLENKKIKASKDTESKG